MIISIGGQRIAIDPFGGKPGRVHVCNSFRGRLQPCCLTDHVLNAAAWQTFGFGDVIEQDAGLNSEVPIARCVNIGEMCRVAFDGDAVDLALAPATRDLDYMLVCGRHAGSGQSWRIGRSDDAAGKMIDPRSGCRCIAWGQPTVGMSGAGPRGRMLTLIAPVQPCPSRRRCADLTSAHPGSAAQEIPGGLTDAGRQSAVAYRLRWGHQSPATRLRRSRKMTSRHCPASGPCVIRPNLRLVPRTSNPKCRCKARLA